tara:strand:- start:730 stop:963 length:234 start_codon:yes stop_codon:yes gene_type:complete
MSPGEFDKIVSHYIKDIVIDGYPHYLLVMHQFDIIDIYNKDKYCILEVLQDIDGIHEQNNIDTKYYEEYYKRYITEV